jgi:hypothetical protein
MEAFMKDTILLITCFMTMSFNNALAYSDQDQDKMMELSRSGHPVLKKGETCPSHSPLLFAGADNRYASHCVKKEIIPSTVSAEISMMKEYELENESDYDQRVTELVILKSDRFNTRFISTKTLKKYFKALDVDHDNLLENITLSVKNYNRENPLRNYDSLFVGEEYKDDTYLSTFLKSQLSNKQVLKIELNDGVELYPGGGLSVSYSIFMIEGYLIYTKHMNWDA